MEYVLITCDPGNPASAGTCRLAGGRLPETAAVPESHDMYARGLRRVLVYRFDLAHPDGGNTATFPEKRGLPHDE